MRDIQNNKDNRNIKIREVGIEDMVLPLFVSDKSKN